MKWVDYREKLGIGFNDDDKYKMLMNIVQNFIEGAIGDSYSIGSYFAYCQMTGELCRSDGYLYKRLINSFDRCHSMVDLISHYVAFYNTYTPTYNNCYCFIDNKNEVIDYFKQALNSINIKFELLEDDDGVFIFPNGAKELDDALVSEPLEWLKYYPNTHKTYVIALKQYSEGVYIRDVADNLRKTLEAFLQEFLGNTKNLETNKNEICKYLGEQGVDPGIIGLFQPLINSYKNINDRIAKHNDAVEAKLLEFLLYQTGILIRMVLSVNKS